MSSRILLFMALKYFKSQKNKLNNGLLVPIILLYYIEYSLKFNLL